MNPNFKKYAQYYDLLYSEKNYKKEAEYIDHLIKEKERTSNLKILDLGCGTGKHDYYLSEIGHSVEGVDISNEMIALAKLNYGSVVTFHQSDISEFTHPEHKKFDVVISLFHVMSYLTTNNKIIRTLNTVSSHLKKGGLFIFDGWYGPGVLQNPPRVKVKKIKTEKSDILRLSEPTMYYNKNMVQVEYEIYEIGESRIVNQIQESHNMRYFFVPEIEYMLHTNKFNLLEAFEEGTKDSPNSATWNIIFIAKKLN